MALLGTPAQLIVELEWVLTLLLGGLLMLLKLRLELMLLMAHSGLCFIAFIIV